MTLPSSGTLTISQINSEFGRGLDLGSYRGTVWYTDAGSSGTFTNTNLGFDQFYGKRATAPYRFGTGSASFTNYITYGYSVLTVYNGQPYADFQIWLWNTTSGQPYPGLVVQSSLNANGYYSLTTYTPNTEKYWYPAPQTNYFYLLQKDAGGTYRLCNYFSASS